MTDEIKILFLGDTAGRPGRRAVKAYIAALKEKNNMPDFIIANVENASHGFGLTKKNYSELISCGIDCFTSGNHIFDKREIFEYIDNADKLLRPINYPKCTKGQGFKVFETQKCKIGVINVSGRTFMPAFESYFDLLDNAIDEIKKETNIIFMDIHAEATAEKISLARYYAKKGVSFIAGTHTHVQTADEQLINNRCAYITDAGFCGAYESVIGMDYEISIRRLKTMMPDRLEPAETDKVQINGVLASININTGYANSIKRINEIKFLNDAAVFENPSCFGIEEPKQ